MNVEYPIIISKHEIYSLRNKDKLASMYLDYRKELESMDQFFKDSTDEKRKNYIETVLSCELAEIYTAEANNQLVGFAIVLPGEVLKECGYKHDEWFILDTYVEPPYRRKHIASCIVNEIMEKHSGSNIAFEYLELNHTAQNFWNNTMKNAGYTEDEKKAASIRKSYPPESSTFINKYYYKKNFQTY